MIFFSRQPGKRDRKENFTYFLNNSANLKIFIKGNKLEISSCWASISGFFVFRKKIFFSHWPHGWFFHWWIVSIQLLSDILFERSPTCKELKGLAFWLYFLILVANNIFHFTSCFSLHFHSLQMIKYVEILSLHVY